MSSPSWAQTEESGEATSPQSVRVEVGVEQRRDVYPGLDLVEFSCGRMEWSGWVLLCVDQAVAAVAVLHTFDMGIGNDPKGREEACA